VCGSAHKSRENLPQRTLEFCHGSSALHHIYAKMMTLDTKALCGKFTTVAWWRRLANFYFAI
jgi:hypothetical protein